MKISSHMTDQSIMKELGERLASARIEHNLTQAALAEQAGVAKRTVERLESGQVATQLSGFLRVCRALSLLDRLDTLLPVHEPGPMAQLKQQNRKRRRATGKKTVETPKPWTWGESP
jgi:transcriptional regulator with XRE-family HTH domain